MGEKLGSGVGEKIETIEGNKAVGVGTLEGVCDGGMLGELVGIGVNGNDSHI